MKDYCTQNDGKCDTCSLVNYGRDCRNNKIVTDNIHLCAQCGQDMGMEYILGAVCGNCCRLNHRHAMGKV